jgi:hypothetical protein
MAIEIKIAELRSAINRILNHIEYDLGMIKIALDKDHYWDMFSEDIYDLAKDPKNFGVEQLGDDWEFLSGILKDKDRAVALMLIHASPLPRRIGEQVRE